MLIYCVVDNDPMILELKTFLKMTFSPERADNSTIICPLVISGKTYRERKEDFIDKVHAIQESYTNYCGLSYMGYMIIDNFLLTNARRYGLTTVFRNEGII